MKRKRLNAFFTSYNVVTAALLLVMMFPGVVPLEVRADVTGLTGRSEVARILDVALADPGLGTLRLDGSAVGRGECRGWVCTGSSGVHHGEHRAVHLWILGRGAVLAAASCTGVLLEDRVSVVTAAHCLDDPGAVEVRVLGATPVVAKARSYRLHRTWDPRDAAAVDVAVVELASPLEGIETFPVGDRIRGQLDVWGAQSTSGGHAMHRCRPTFSQVEVVRLVESGPTVSVPCGLRPGASGGPVFTETPAGPALLAVVVAVDEDGRNYLAPVGDLTKDFGPPVVLTTQ